MSATQDRVQGLRHAAASWSGLRVVVAGIGVSGFAAADALLERGAQVVIVDAASGRPQRERSSVLSTLGADVRLGPEHAQHLPEIAGAPPDLVVTSPGWSPQAPLLVQAAEGGIPVWAEVELAWRMRPARDAAPG